MIFVPQKKKAEPTCLSVVSVTRDVHMQLKRCTYAGKIVIYVIFKRIKIYRMFSVDLELRNLTSNRQKILYYKYRQKSENCTFVIKTYNLAYLYISFIKCSQKILEWFIIYILTYEVGRENPKSFVTIQANIHIYITLDKLHELIWSQSKQIVCL